MWRVESGSCSFHRRNSRSCDVRGDDFFAVQLARCGVHAKIGRMHSFDPFPVLETPRLLLRELVPSDAEVIRRNSSDPDVLRYLGRDGDDTLDAAHKRLQVVFDAIREHSGIRWGICLRDEPTIMGTVGFWRWNKPHFYAEIGYEMSPNYWNKGYMTEAVRAALRFGFEHMELHRVEANIVPGNAGSRRVVEKLGFTQEGILRQNWFYAGQFTDSIIYGLLKHEFAASVANSMRG
jgi:[ribosomal protein S5]-alanine N-acetyltransferase